MRMDRSSSTTAAELVNQAGERDLAEMIFKLGKSATRAALREPL